MQVNPMHLVEGQTFTAPYGAEVVEADQHGEHTELARTGETFLVADEPLFDADGSPLIPVLFGADTAGCVRLPRGLMRVHATRLHDTAVAAAA